VDWIQISAISDILAAIGVIVSLIYVAQQLKRSDESARAASIRSVLDGWHERFSNPASQSVDFVDCFAHGLNSLEALNETDKRRFFYIMSEHVLHMQNIMQLHDRGLVSEEDHEAWLAFVASVLVTPGGSDIWKIIRVTIAPTVVRSIERFIETNPDLPSYLDLNPLMRTDGSATLDVQSDHQDTFNKSRFMPNT
jgi:hypothetical protein